MSFVAAEQFRLHENHQSLSWQSMREQSEIADYQLVLRMDKLNASTMVQSLLVAIMRAQALDKPLLLARGAINTVPELPQQFCLGIQTSGTTGKPKWQLYQLEHLLPKHSGKEYDSRWLLCFSPFTFAGLQVILHCAVNGESLVVDETAPLHKKVELCRQHGVNTLSCTPSFLRAFMLAGAQELDSLVNITLGGEAAEQAILDDAKRCWPQAKIRHIYATTESGVVFTVKDGIAGFPQEWLEQNVNAWQLSISEHKTLVLVSEQRRIDTGDMISIIGTRCYFAGRIDNLVNVGGVKVNPEQVEAEIKCLDCVLDARVFAKANAITGFILGAEICSSNQSNTEIALAKWCQQQIPARQPRIIQWVEQISLAQSQKKQRIQL